VLSLERNVHLPRLNQQATCSL